MAGLATGGILQGLMDGWDQQNEINRRNALDAEARAERERQAGREARADERVETVFEHGLEDRSHMLKRRPILEQREDETYGLDRSIRGMQAERGRMELDRLPTKYAQEDAEFDLGQQAKRQSMAESGQRMSLNAMRIELERMGIDEKRLDMGIAKARNAIGAGFAQGRATGDWNGLAEAYNSTIGSFGGAPIAGITQNEDGSFTITSAGGKVTQFANQDQLLRAAATMVDPRIYVQAAFEGIRSQQEEAAARAKNPKNFTELVRGDDGSLQQFDYATGRTAPIMDESGQPAKGTLAGREREGTPAQIAAKFYADQVKDGARADDAAKVTAHYMRRAHPEAEGWWAPRRVDPQWGDEGAAPPPRFAAQPQRSGARPGTSPAPGGSHGRVVRTGTANGRRVAQYEDGTILPLE